jgi:VIT1/CCC1 family predicted Fe2+/Mn2+ transporter
MLSKIIGALLLVAFFFILSKAASGMLGKDYPLSKVFPIGSSLLVAFLLGLMFIGE